METAQIWREHYDRKKKMYRRLAGYVFQRVQITTGKNYDRKKKVQSSRLTGRFFRRVQITTRKNYDRKNKRYRSLADGGGSDLAGMLQPEKKTYRHLAIYVFQRVQITI